MKVRYESPVVVEAVPKGLKSRRKVLGKVTGELDLLAVEAWEMAGSCTLVRENNVEPRIDYYFLAETGRHYVLDPAWSPESGVLGTESGLAPMREALRRIENEMLRTGKAERESKYHPAWLVEAFNRTRVSGRYPMPEIEPWHYTDFDQLGLEAQQAAMADALSGVVMGGKAAFVPVPSPFVAITWHKASGFHLACHSGIDARTFIDDKLDVVAVFGAEDVEAADRLLADLAAIHAQRATRENFSIEIHRPETVSMGADTWLVRLMASHALSQFGRHANWMGARRVAEELSFDVLAAARELRAAAAGNNEERLVSAVDNCLRLDDPTGHGIFVDRVGVVGAILLERWDGRAIVLDAAAPAASL
jgi:hypothetical protein